MTVESEGQTKPRPFANGAADHALGFFERRANEPPAPGTPGRLLAAGAIVGAVLAVGLGLASDNRNVFGILLALLPQAGLAAAAVGYRITWLRRLRRGDDVRTDPPPQNAPSTVNPKPKQILIATMVAVTTFVLVLVGGSLVLDDESRGVAIFAVAFISMTTVTGAYNRYADRRRGASA